MSNKIIITIDGWSSCGKSTLAKQLSKELGYTYIDSGAMYRAITLYFLRNHIDWTDNNEVEAALKDIHLHFEPNEKSGESEMGKKKGIVMDGRDIGTTVFPDAELKIFMTADIPVRVERRFKEMYEKNPNITIEDVKHNLEMRDYIDSHREVSPLKKADDAITLDNTDLTMEEQLKFAQKLVRQPA